LDKPGAHPPGGKPAGHPPAAKAAASPSKAAAKPGASPNSPKQVDSGQRVGGYSALSGWFLGLVAGVIVMGMAGFRPAWLFLVVGLLVVGVSFAMASFLGGRLTKGWLPPAGGTH
jgi:hypothetical protein